MKHAQMTFLLVEDNELDVEKIQRGLARLRIDNPVIRARNGYEALDVLRGVDGTPPLGMPYIILLDLNMPKMNGIEFLQEIRRDPTLAGAPVFVLTTSDRSQDIEDAHRHNICGYIVKPMGVKDMVTALGALKTYLDLCEFPSRNVG